MLAPTKNSGKQLAELRFKPVANKRYITHVISKTSLSKTATTSNTAQARLQEAKTHLDPNTQIFNTPKQHTERESRLTTTTQGSYTHNIKT